MLQGITRDPNRSKNPRCTILDENFTKKKKYKNAMTEKNVNDKRKKKSYIFAFVVYIRAPVVVHAIKEWRICERNVGSSGL
jgi:hypothetical protein